MVREKRKKKYKKSCLMSNEDMRRDYENKSRFMLHGSACKKKQNKNLLSTRLTMQMSFGFRFFFCFVITPRSLALSFSLARCSIYPTPASHLLLLLGLENISLSCVDNRTRGEKRSE